MRVLAGDVDVTKGLKPLAITKTDLKILPKHGTVKWHDNYISYTPQNDFVGSDNFTIVVTGSVGEVTGASTLDVAVNVK
jgi:hypothetical protein